MSSSNHSYVQYRYRNASDPETKTDEILIVFFSFLGMAIIITSIFIGDSRVFSALVIFISFFVTVLWGNYKISWIFLASILAASPTHKIDIFPINLIFAIWFIMFNRRYVLDLPKWIYLPILFAILAFIFTSINWFSVDLAKSILVQIRYMLIYLMGPLFLLPIIYFRMGKSRDNVVKLKGLLFYFIIPSTLILCIAYWFGTPIKMSKDIDLQLPYGLMSYKLGNTVVNFNRTTVGFILSAFMCASTAVIVSPVKIFYRLLATLCLILNSTLLLITGSVGSTIACLFGLAAIFYAQFRKINLLRFLISIIGIVFLLFLIWILSPVSVRNYAERRYQERVEYKEKGMNLDRFMLWERAIHYLYEHPEGVGWTLTVGDRIKSNPHNDYLVYAVSYGIIGGIIYGYLVLRLLIYFFRKSKTIIKDPYAMAVTLAGLGVVVVAFVNSMTDHMVASLWYFHVIWSIIWYSYFSSQTDYSNS